MITSSAFAKALYPGVNAFWEASNETYESFLPYLYDKHNSNRAFEEDVSVSGFGLAQVKNSGGGVAYDIEQQGFLTRYSHITYALAFAIERELYEDDMYDITAQRKAEGLAQSMNETREINGHNVYNRAFNSSYTFGDGKELLATDHPNIAGGTFANELTTAADLSEASIEQATIDIAKMTNDRGLRVLIKPKCLIVPSELMYVADRILKGAERPGTANRDINALNLRGTIPEIISTPYLTDADAWFIRTNAPHGMKQWQRRDLEFTIDNDFDSENAKFKATERYSFGNSNPRALFGSPGA